MNSIPCFAICDDDEIVCEAVSNKVKGHFELCGIEIKVESFTSSMELYNIIKNDNMKYDLLLLDIDMPKLNGVDLAEKVKSINKDIDIIFISNREGKVLLGKLFKKSKTIKHKQQVRERVRVRVSSSDSFYDRKFIGRNV